MRRLALAAAIAGCSPPADTVGAWTTGGTAGETTSSTTEPDELDSGDVSSSSSPAASSSSSSSSSSSGSTTEGPIAPPRWVATVADGAAVQLRAIDVDGGVVVDVCELAGVAAPDGLAFLPDGRLAGAHAPSASLWVADPCDCAIDMLPPLEPPLALHAMAERDDPEPTIVGVDALRMGLFAVPVDAPVVMLVADLANAGAITAIAAAPGTDDLWALASAGGPHLLRIDVAGATVSDVALAIPDDATGLTAFPGEDTLLACDGEGSLWRIDPVDGASDALAAASPDPCRTLATPPAAIACIDALFAG